VAIRSGLNMSRWKTEPTVFLVGNFRPDNRIVSVATAPCRRDPRRVINGAATALRMAATTLMRRHSLVAQSRRLGRKLGAPKALTDRAHRLARPVNAW
jgi:hypothetical protein